MTQNVSNPSRRSVAKGAAWAVPAVAVAASAPSLAASPLPTCEAAALTVTANCPGLLSTDSLNFTITNASGSGCVVPVGTPVDITVTGLVGLTLDLLVDANAGLLYTDGTTLFLNQELAAGQSITLEVFPDSLLNLQAVGDATVSILGASGTASYTMATVAGLTVAICA